MVSKVHPSGGQTMTSVSPSAAERGEARTEVVQPLKRRATEKLVEELKTVNDLSSGNDEQDVFSLLRDNAQKRYGNGDAPMVRRSPCFLHFFFCPLEGQDSQSVFTDVFRVRVFLFFCFFFCFVFVRLHRHAVVITLVR